MGVTGFEINVGVHQSCVMSPWLFNIFIDGATCEMGRGDYGAWLNHGMT